jgi:hypothetical protein
MRRWRAIAAASALEILGEPLVFLVSLASLALATLAPALHYHQFGEATRMARDAGLSAILLGGAVVAFSGTVRTFRREIESGTASTALAHSVSRTSFFLAKTLGCVCAYLWFAVSVSAVATTVVRGAAIGGEIAAARGDIARLWGPSFSCALAAIVLPVSLAAVLNRFARCRFTLTANVLMLLTAVLGVAYRFDAALTLRHAPVFALAAGPALVLLTATAALSVRFKANAAAAGVALLAAVTLPALGNYCLSDALSDGASLELRYFLAASVALLPGAAACLLAGIYFINGRDVQ